MKKETIVTAKTVEAAKEIGAAELGVSVDIVEIEVIEEPSKGFLGFGASDAKVKVSYELTRGELARDFLEKLFGNMKLDAKLDIEEKDDEINVKISGDNMGILIGRHGEILDSLQYLTGFAANNGRDDHTRVTVDVENYRARREDALRILAKRMADKAKKYRKSFTLEPMPAYERRIIHSQVQEMHGVTTYSIGQGNDRRVVIAVEKMRKQKNDHK
ncbi:MAG: protein jag [Clostridia bacterium]|nr:protein jag [Clostridia bacterium]MBQ6905591.1 protein jag [Clostridia bacterium]